MNWTPTCSKIRISLLVGLVAALAQLVPAGQAVAQGNPNQGIAPPTSRPYGKSYGAWGAAWWKWALGIPLAENPLVDETGEFADVDQAGPVWFLAGNFGGTTVRDVEIPAGKAMFFPVMNAAWWAPEDLELAADVAEFLGLDPDDMTDEELLRVLANFSVDGTTALSLTIDGTEMQDLFRYRAESPAFHITDDDLLLDLGYDDLDDRLAVADGYWIMLAPLSVGEHTIRFTGANAFFGFGLDVTYHITVVPR